MDTNKLIALLPDMATFVTVVEQQSFSKAADQLGVAASSVSRSVARLETALATKLLERTTRRLRLTVAGEETFALCQSMLQNAQQAASAAQSNSEQPTGLLTVAAPQALARIVLSPVILDFIATYPDIRLRFKVEDRYLDPIADNVDVVIHLTDTPIAGLIAKPLGRVRMLLCASPAYLNQAGTPQHPEDLAQHRCITLSEDQDDTVWRLRKDKQTCNVPVNGPLSVNHSSIRKQAALRGMGIALFPDFVVATELQRGDIVQVLPDWQMDGKYQGTMVAQYAQSRYIPTQVRAFIDFLTDAFA